MNILLVKTGALGDVVRTTSLIPALKRTFNAHITWLTSYDAFPLIRHDMRFASDLINRQSRVWNSLYNIPYHYDWIINLEDDIEISKKLQVVKADKYSGAVLLGKHVTYTPDLEDWFGMGILRPQSRGGLEVANKFKKANTRTYYELLYSGLGLELPIEKPQIFFPQKPKYQLKKYGVIVGLNTGAGGRWKYKSLGIVKTVELAKKLAANSIQVLLLGGNAEQERNLLIAQEANSPFVQPFNTDGDLHYFASVISQCDAVVSSDSLAMHLAVAVGTPVVAFFGPTSGAEIDLFGNGIKIETQLPCGRCYLSSCNVRSHCMENMNVDELYNATLDLLNRY